MRGVDYSAATEFLRRFFEGTEHAVEIRALPNVSGSGRARPLFGRDPDLVLAHCERWDERDMGVFFGVATRLIGAGGARKDLAELPAVWADIDTYKHDLCKDNVITAVRSIPLPPSVIVDSGGGLHCYWLLREPLDVRICRTTLAEAREMADRNEPLPEEFYIDKNAEVQFKRGAPDSAEAIEAEVVAVLKQLAGVVAGDTAVCDLARVLRLPGTHNTKGDEPRPVSVLPAVSNWRRYDFPELVEMLDYLGPVLRKPDLVDLVDSVKTVNSDPYLAAAARFAIKPPMDIEHRLAAMSYQGDGDNGVHQTQLAVSAAMVARGASDEEIVAVLLDATRAAAGLAGEHWNWQREAHAIQKMIDSFRKKRSTEISGAATVVQLRPSRSEATEDKPEKPPKEQFVDPDRRWYHQNDSGNAMALVDLHGSSLRWADAIGWHVWDGKRFERDVSAAIVEHKAKDVSLDMLDRLPSLPPKARDARFKWAIQAGNSARLAGMVRGARVPLMIKAESLDADPLTLNCQNGTLDLRTLELRPHRREDLLTKIVTTDYDPRALCPRWEDFVSEIFDGDGELVEFLQRALGYSLTGSMQEQVVFILHGIGENGKSVLLDTVSEILGDYATSSPADTWISKPAGGPSNDIAALVGARFVSAVETERDRNLAEALVKQATGGDKITARFLHKEFFSFKPSFKLWLATNHKPKIRGADHAIWRRIRLLPFHVVFADRDKMVAGQKEKDPHLLEKLAQERPGILAWLVRGFERWNESGLTQPEAVIEATESYRSAQDNVSGFIAERCIVARSSDCASGLLYAGYQAWCEEVAEEPVSQKVFGQNLDERGFAPRKGNYGVRVRKGIDIKAEFRQEAQFRPHTR